MKLVTFLIFFNFHKLLEVSVALLPVLGKLHFTSNCLQLLVTNVKKVFNFLYFFTKISKVTCYNYNYFSKVKKLLLRYIHLAAECDINSNNYKIMQKSYKSLQSASGSHIK